MKGLFLATTGALILFMGCSAPSKISSSSTANVVTIVNPSNINRTDELVSVDYQKLKSKLPGDGNGSFKLLDANTKKELPYQVEYLGQASPKNILIMVSMSAGEKLEVAFVEGVPAQIPTRTFARYVPERFDDFAWENDRVAFRMYGKALNGRKDNAFGIDVWAKRTPNMIINKWYKSEDYHKDHGEGLDYYAVGKSLGAGDIGIYLNDTISFTNNYDNWKVLDNGPLRSSFELYYKQRNAAGVEYSLTKRIQIDAGSQLSKVWATFDFKDAMALPVVAGIVQTGNKDKLYENAANNLLGLWQPDIKDNGQIGCGLVFPGSSVKLSNAHNHLLAQTKAVAGIPVIYYTGAVWNKANTITTPGDWFNYLQSFAKKIKAPLEISFE